jgi:hypothetical protein
MKEDDIASSETISRRDGRMAVRRVIYVPHGRSRIVNHASPQCLGAENQAGTERLVHAFMLKERAAGNPWEKVQRRRKGPDLIHRAGLSWGFARRGELHPNQAARAGISAENCLFLTQRNSAGEGSGYSIL